MLYFPDRKSCKIPMSQKIVNVACLFFWISLQQVHKNKAFVRAYRYYIDSISYVMDDSSNVNLNHLTI